MTIREAKALSAENPYAGRLYPRPGYEKKVADREEVRTVVNLDGRAHTVTLRVTYYLENCGGSFRVKEYTDAIEALARRGLLRY